MKKFANILIIFVSLLITGCGNRVSINGTTSLHELEDRMLYLHLFEDGDLRIVDSTRIVHGKFQFSGAKIDSATIAFLYLEDMRLMPIVVEPNPLSVTLNENEYSVDGSELNDSLFAFIQRKNNLDLQLAELPRKESQMILEGMDHDDVLIQLSQEAAILNAQEEELVMRFIKDNMDNVLAPGVFMMITYNIPTPMLNPQIEELATLGSSRFLNDPYVRNYLKRARENMENVSE